MSQRLNLFCWGLIAISTPAFVCLSYRQSSAPVPIIAAKRHFLASFAFLDGPLKGEPIDVDGLAFSADGRTLVAWAESPNPMDEGAAWQWWDVATKKRLRDNDPKAEHFNKKRQVFNGLKGVLTEDGFDLQNVKTSEVIRRFDSPNEYNCNRWRWTFSPDGKQLWWADGQRRIFWQSVE